jgi:hypothetical protein
LLGTFLLLGFWTPAPGADSLTWHSDKDRVDADITSWSLVRTLEHISEATGWQIYLEPGTQRKVSTKFRDRPRDKALDLLLGNLGRVLLPGTNGGSPRLLVFRNTEKDATRLIRGRDKRGKPIPNELIVTMKQGKSLDDMAKKIGAKIVGRSQGLNSGRLRFEDEEAANNARETLLSDEDVAGVDPNFPILSEPTPEGSSAGAGPDLKLRPLKDGDPIVVVLIDTDVQLNGDSRDKFLMPKISVAGEADTSQERPTHGTSMLDELLVNGCESGSRIRILPVDVYGNNATTTTYEVAEGIYQGMQKGGTVFNLSLGSDGDTPYLHDLIKKGAAAGRIFVASAGNTPVTSPTFPAAYPEVIAVTAGDAKGKLAPYANRGDFVDVMAPGTAVINFNGQAWRVTGTSPAAAYVSGAIAGRADCSGQSLGQAAAAILSSSPPPTGP